MLIIFHFMLVYNYVAGNCVKCVHPIFNGIKAYGRLHEAVDIINMWSIHLWTFENLANDMVSGLKSLHQVSSAPFRATW